MGGHSDRPVFFDMKSKSVFSKPAVMWLTAGLCCLLWGSAFPAIKAGYSLLKIESFDTPSILLFAGIRFFFAGVLTVIIFSLIERKALFPKRSSFKKIGVLSLFQTVLQYIFFYLGLAFTSGERGAIVNGTSVFFAILISSLLFKMEKLSARKIAGCVLGFMGVILVSLDAFSQGAASFKGEVFILLSSISYAFSSVFMKCFSEDDNPAMLSGWQFVLGGAVLTLSGFALGGRLEIIGVKAVLLIAYLALLSALAYSLWSILLKYNEVSRVTVCSFMIPVFGCVLSALFSDAEFSNPAVIIIALAVVVIGIILVNSGGKFRKNVV